MRNICIGLLAIVLAACDAEPPRPADSAVVPAAVDSPVAADPEPVRSSWDAAAGPVLLVAGERPDQAIVVAPEVGGVVEPESLDVSELAGAAATLLGRGGTAQTVMLGEELASGVAACNSWPVLAAPPSTSRWSVGFLDSAVAPLAMDSLPALSRRDSLRLVSQIARLASGLEASRTGEHAARFQGLPFVVYEARRFVHDGTEVVAANVVRRVNQEAMPLEEHTLIIAERRNAGGDWRVARTERSAGREETVARHEVLGAALLRGEPLVVLSRDGGSEVRYIIRWRSGGRWSRVWASGTSRC